MILFSIMAEEGQGNTSDRADCTVWIFFTDFVAQIHDLSMEIIEQVRVRIKPVCEELLYLMI